MLERSSLCLGAETRQEALLAAGIRAAAAVLELCVATATRLEVNGASSLINERNRRRYDLPVIDYVDMTWIIGLRLEPLSSSAFLSANTCLCAFSERAYDDCVACASTGPWHGWAGARTCTRRSGPQGWAGARAALGPVAQVSLHTLWV